MSDLTPQKAAPTNSKIWDGKQSATLEVAHALALCLSRSQGSCSPTLEKSARSALHNRRGQLGGSWSHFGHTEHPRSRSSQPNPMNPGQVLLASTDLFCAKLKPIVGCPLSESRDALWPHHQVS